MSVAVTPNSTRPPAPPTDALQRERFLGAAAERGPHFVPRARQISRPFHRLFSFKAGSRIVACDAALVADAVLMAEGDPGVVGLCERPLRILGPVGQHPHLTFDLALTARTGRETVYRVVQERMLESAKDGRRLPPHWLDIEAWCEAHGHVCDVLTDADVRAHRVRIDNWRLLLPFARIAREASDPALAERVLDVLGSQRQLSLLELPGYLPRTDGQALTAAVAALLHDGTCDAALDERPFTPRTPVRIRSGA